MAIPALDMVCKELESDDLSLMENSLALTFSKILKSRFQRFMLDKFYWIANCLDPRFGYDSFENENYLITLNRTLLIVIELDSAKDVQQREVSASQDAEQNPKRRKSLFSLKRYSDEPQTLLFRDDRIDMELAMFKAEARGMKGIIELDPVRWWIRNSSKMPLMSKLAMIYLLPPASTADVEIAR